MSKTGVETRTSQKILIIEDEELPSLIILDNKLPDGYGVDYISHVKKKYPSVRIIMITGFDASVKDVAMENGADLFLEKPFTKKEFLAAIKSLLNLSDH